LSAQFDGSATYLSRTGALTGVSSSKIGTFSLWLKTTAETGTIVAGGATAAADKFIIDLTDGKVRVTLRNSAGTTLWQATTSAINTGLWKHVAGAFTLGTPTAYLYVNRASDETEATEAIDGTVDWAGATIWTIGATVDGTSFFDGALYDFLLWPGTFIDLSDATERKFLVSSDGLNLAVGQDYPNLEPTGVKPVGYGHDASLPTSGVRPAIYFGGGWNQNRGTGGLFTRAGAFESQSSPDNPNAYRKSALWRTPGQRWFDSEQGGFSYPRAETFVEKREGHPAFGKRMGLDERDEETRDVGPLRAVSVSTLVRGGTEEDREDNR
jgi:hypothetical protein